MEPKSIIPALHGVGYVREQARSGHRCGRCMNPHTRSGGNPDCPNNRASQTVPYEEEAHDGD